MEKKENNSTKAITIEHKTNLRGEELEKDPNHKLLQEFCKKIQNNQDIQMKNIKKKIEMLGSRIETTYINEVKRLATNSIKAIPERTVEMRKLINEYFDLLQEATQRAMKKLDLVKTTDTKDIYDNKKQKIIPKSIDSTYIKIKRIINAIKSIENMIKKADNIMHTIKQEWNRGKRSTKNLLEATALI